MAPKGTITKLLPEQTEPEFTPKVGLGETLTVETAVLLLKQPAVLVPVIEYDVVALGFTVPFPLEYVYVPAPLGTITKLFPEQIEPLLTVIVGLAFTVTVAVAVFCAKQPAVLVPFTV